MQKSTAGKLHCVPPASSHIARLDAQNVNDETGRPPIAPMLPIAMIGIRHVPPAANTNRIFHFGIASQGAHADFFVAAHESVSGRFCCKSLFALAIKISFGCTRDFRVKMWGTSSPEDKLTGDLDKVIEATSIRRSWVRFFYSRKIGTGQFGTFATKSAQLGRTLSARTNLIPVTEVKRTRFRRGRDGYFC